jgi:hypothetical protein
VIVRDAGDAWQVVLQTDHADVSGACARRWVDVGPRHASVVVAAERHDDGWAVWEQSPAVDVGTGKPLNFLDVPVPAHLAFYRAGIAAVADEDSYAGLLVSMHGAGIYRRRYGAQPELQLSRAAEVTELVEAFVEEQEQSHTPWRDEIGVTDEERWADYFRLQVYDRFSLFFCLRDLETAAGEEIGGYRLEPVGPARVSMEPYPFRSDVERFTLLRRLLPKRERTQGELRHGLLDTPAERWEIEVAPAA